MSTKTQRAHWCAIVLQACSYWLYLEDMCYWWDHKHLCIIDYLMCNKERWLKRSRWPLTLKLKIMVSQYNSPKLEVPFFILFWSPLPHSLMKTTSTRLLMIANDGRCQSHHSGILLSAHLHPKGMVFFHRSLSDHCMPVRETRWGGASTQPEMDYICPQSTGACLSPDPIVHPYAGKEKKKISLSMDFLPFFFAQSDSICAWS